MRAAPPPPHVFSVQLYHRAPVCRTPVPNQNSKAFVRCRSVFGEEPKATPPRKAKTASGPALGCRRFPSRPPGARQGARFSCKPVEGGTPLPAPMEMMFRPGADACGNRCCGRHHSSSSVSRSDWQVCEPSIGETQSPKQHVRSSKPRLEAKALTLTPLP